MVSVSGYLIGSQERNKTPLPPEAELQWWYQYYFATERGRAGYDKYRHDFASSSGSLLHRNGISMTPRSTGAPKHSTTRIMSTSSSTIIGGASASPRAKRSTTIWNGGWPWLRSSPCRPSPWKAMPTARRIRPPAPMPANSRAGMNTASSRRSRTQPAAGGASKIRASRRRRRPLLKNPMIRSIRSALPSLMTTALRSLDGHPTAGPATSGHLARCEIRPGCEPEFLDRRLPPFRSALPPGPSSRKQVAPASMQPCRQSAHCTVCDIWAASLSRPTSASMTGEPSIPLSSRVPRAQRIRRRDLPQTLPERFRGLGEPRRMRRDLHRDIHDPRGMHWLRLPWRGRRNAARSHRGRRHRPD